MNKLTTIIALLLIISISCKTDSDDDLILIPVIPVAIDASNILNNSFDANWTASENAQEYESELSLHSDFKSIEGHNQGSELSTTFTGLNPNTRYYYRVRAVNEDKTSGYSNIISTLTSPDPPHATSATLIGSESFQANWNWSPGITNYKLYVSTIDFPHNQSENLPNYNGITVNANKHVVQGLNSSTTYYYALEASNGNYTSPLSNVIICTTIN